MTHSDATALIGRYDPLDVVLSVVIAIVAAYIGLNLARHATESRGGAKIFWQTTGAIAMGTGIWSMHFMGMLAFELPSPVAYHVPTVLLSLVAAIVACFVALIAVSSEQLSRLRLLSGGILMGSGIAAMHYTGMAAMRMAAVIHYDPLLLGLSVVLAVGLSLVALVWIFKFRGVTVSLWHWRLVGSAALLGLAIPVMHYTGMEAATFIPAADASVGLSGTVGHSMLGFAAALAAPFIMLTLTVTASVVGGRMAKQATRLQTSEARFKAAFEHASIGMGIVGLQGLFLQVNQAMCKLLGYSETELLGMTFLSVTHPDDVPISRDWAAKLLAGEASHCGMEKRYLTKDGSIVWAQVTVTLMRDPFGLPSYFITQVTNITERKRAEQHERVQYIAAKILAEAPSQTEAKLAVLKAMCEQLRFVIGVAWKVDRSSDSLTCTEIWHEPSEELGEFAAVCRTSTFSSGVGLPGRVWASGEPDWVKDAATDQTMPRARHAARAHLHGAFAVPVRVGNSVEGVIEFFSLVPMSLDQDLIAVMEGIGNQIGQFVQRKQAETALSESRAFLDAIIENIPLGIFVKNAKDHFRFVLWNKAAESMSGLTREQVLGRTDFDFMPKEQAQYYESVNQRVMREGPLVDAPEAPIESRSRGPINLRTVKLPLMTQDGAPTHLLAISEDITERKKAQETLARTVRELEAANRELVQARDLALSADHAKSDFLARMSHEIRTPMNGVIGMTGLLLDTPLNQEQRQYADIVRNSGETLLSVINDILDFSKIDAGKISLEPVDFTIRTVVEDVLDLLSPNAAQGVELVGLTHATVPQVLRGDPGRIRQVLANLIGNAIKFTKEGEVTVDVTVAEWFEEAVTLRVVISDTGIGISAEGQKKLFQPFSQAEGSTTRNYGGTGLGLAISKRLVELMGGSIGVESRKGEGSQFWFTVQLKRVVETPTSPAQQASLDGARVLIVDDNKSSRLALHHYTQTWLMKSDCVKSGTLALAMLRKAAERAEPYEVAILDRQMLEMDGLVLARAIKSDPQIASVRLVMLTPMGKRDEIGTALQGKIAACLTKPVHQEDLYATLKRVMGRAPQSAGATARSSQIEIPDAVKRTSRAGRRILLVEDNVINQKVGVRMLEKLGCSVDAVANGLEAVQACATIPYALVFMDCNMPEMDGFEATRLIRERESIAGSLGGEAGPNRPPQDSGLASRPGSHIPIIALTASVLPEDQDDCLKAGMDDIVGKPISVEDLEAVLDRWLAPADPESKSDGHGLQVDGQVSSSDRHANSHS